MFESKIRRNDCLTEANLEKLVSDSAADTDVSAAVKYLRVYCDFPFFLR